MADKSPRTALVTGAGDRLGKAMALALADWGWAVAVHYRSSQKKAEDVVAQIVEGGGKAATFAANLSAEGEAQGMFQAAQDALGPIHLLVNSASAFERDEIDTMSRESWDLHIETNLRAPIALAQAFAVQPRPTDDADRLIVNLIDQRVRKLTPQFFTYTLSKAALYDATITLAQALAPQNIRVNGIGPGPTMRNVRQSEDDWRRQNEATVLGRGATPDDIVGALRYLLDATSVTGQMIAVDGGQHLAWQTPDVLVNE